MIVEAWLARHGETEWNRQRRRQGLLDSPLTADGVEQAFPGLLARRARDRYRHRFPGGEPAAALAVHIPPGTAVHVDPQASDLVQTRRVR